MKKLPKISINYSSTPSNFAERLSGWMPSGFLRIFEGKRLAKNPYWRLMRGDRPAGTALLALPVLWTIAFIGQGWMQIVGWSLFFTFGAFIMRSSGCIINDIIDRKIDKQVHRTENRPLASGELSITQALQLLGVLLGIAFVLLCFLPYTVFIIGVLSVIPIVIYPLMKRVSNYPQVFLGLTFNLGIFMAWFTISSHISYIPIVLYMCAVTWTVGYDTIYAQQDKQDDARIGVKSMALTIGHNAKDLLWRLHIISVSALCIVGLNLDLGVLFYIGALIALCQLNWQVERLDLDDSANCQKKFVSNVDFGAIIWISILLGRLV